MRRFTCDTIVAVNCVLGRFQWGVDDQRNSTYDDPSQNSLVLHTSVKWHSNCKVFSSSQESVFASFNEFGVLGGHCSPIVFFRFG